MEARYLQSRQHGRPSDQNPAITGQHLDQPFEISQNESTLAYDSVHEGQDTILPNLIKYQGMDRIWAGISKLENNEMKIMKSIGRWLGRHITKTPPKRASISVPGEELLPEAALRAIKETTLDIPMLRSQGPELRKENLGQANEALGSHSVATSLNSMEQKSPAQQTLLKSSSMDEENDCAPTVHVESDRPHLRPREPEPTDDAKAKEMADMKAIKAERRKGRIFLPGQARGSFFEFPDPDAWNVEAAEFNSDDEDGHFWEDAGFDTVDEPENGIGEIPSIIISPPDDTSINTGTTPPSREGSKPLLKVDHAYEVLWHKQNAQIRNLKCMLSILQPLAWLVSKAEGIHPEHNPAMLEEALKRIIQDREQLFDLFPLAEILAADQNVDVNDFKLLPQALSKVLSDRDNARTLANYYHATKERYEKRIAQLEKEKEYQQDREDYIRW
ncbi:hypothetical protein F4677DRAFT_458551 [Hypoxylon crocopeplum]|nr:hypothetical protein F4677DRAFT_458551 [Hypoxylon crocopeplum]